MKTIFDNFTNLYSVSKTLRFELIPVGPDGERLDAEDASKLLVGIREQDRKIKDAYVALKPVMDKIHEEVINNSLSSEEAKKIDFRGYLDKYRQKIEQKINITTEEEELRKLIVKTFTIGTQLVKNKAGNDSKGKPVLKKEGVNCLTEAGILKYIQQIIGELKDEKEKEELEIHLKTFKKFFTYFSGYNQNRENYYAKEEKATAVATRIVNDNLPKFCDNCIQFSDGKLKKKNKNNSDTEEETNTRKDEYLNVHQYLKSANRDTQIKDAKTNKMIETVPIDEKMFDIAGFSKCLTQAGIDEYNRIIGHYNFLINLYNQACKDEEGFKKLFPFKTLFKQIGCGEKRALFHALKYDTRQAQDAKEKTTETLNLEDTLKTISQIGNKYFSKPSQENEQTINGLVEWLKKNKNWDGVYWSKAALDKISDTYFANWHAIKDRLLEGLQSKDKNTKAVYGTVASYNKNREEQLKINDAVELSGLFEILDKENENGWTEDFFKESVLEDRKSLLDTKISPSQNLINLLCADMQDLAKEFCTKSADVLAILDYRNEDNILKIKGWLDTVKSIIWLVKYFDVKESKVKGTLLNSELVNMISELLRADDAKWFEWYDAVRNYLTKKPQDDAKENKLKLNFKNPILLGGWSDGQEKSKGSVLLKNYNKYYVGILSERSLFDTAKKNNPVYNAADKSAGRLILQNLAFKTLAGKGFKRDYKEKYSDVGKRDPQEAIKKLQALIEKQFAVKFSLLKPIVSKEYSAKKEFDKEVKDVLAECYECNFKSINWNLVLKYVADEKLYLFEVYSKDFSENSLGNPNLQTKYWVDAFQNNSTIQLCGGGEIFFRGKAINDIIVHPAQKPIYRRSDGKTESIFLHSIIKDKRFTVEKYSFHIPVKINYQAPDNSLINGKVNLKLHNTVNENVNDYFTQDEDIQFLGIDRGEKHLIYYSLVDAKGKIIEQNHFDVINKKDYLQEINESAKKRRMKQENWQQKGNIKNLKDGYISLVIHEIIQKMKDRNGKFKPTFIVLEDLNTGFKRSRQKFEQQVYQKFELALAKKLNYLVDKNVTMDEIGSVAKALQLTPPVANYQDIENRKQLGIMLYTRANYTSVTDPATGWRKTIYLKKGKDIDTQIFNVFTEIKMDERGDYFFQYTDENTGKIWKLWSGKNGKSLERYRSKRGKNKNEWIVKPFPAKEMLDQLFVNFDKNKSLFDQLKNGKALSKIDDKDTAWESMRFVIDIIQQIRNSGDAAKDQSDNFLLSPVRNEQGEHFDSRKYESLQNSDMPKDADANGAFNIARKGIVMYEHIQQWIKDGKPKFKKTTDLDLFISDKEWDLWTANKKLWKTDLNIFASKQKKEDARNNHQ